MKKYLLFFMLELFPVVTWGVNYYWIWIDGICYDLVSNSKTGSTAEVKYVSYIWDYNDEGSYIGDVTIPEIVEYKGITFTVTSIGDNAFMNCHELTSLNILGGVKRIGKNAFGNCENLNSITIPGSVEIIDEWAFGGCWSLDKVYITDLDAWCNVTFYDGFFSSHRLFLNGVEIKDLIIPNGVNSIQPYVFANCTNINSISIPNSVIEIGDWAFGGCSGVFNVELSNSIKTIGRYAFANCNKIEEVIIPNGVSKICEGAFASCHKISSLIISSSVLTIEEEAFSNCGSLASIHVDASNTIYDSRDNCNAIIEKESNSLILGCSTTIIPHSVISIGNKSFSGCTNLSSIDIPSNVKRIGDYAFNNCSSLVHIVIPNNTTEIGHGAFYNCIGLESIELPESVTSIGDYVFSNCNSLIEITIPENLSLIPSGCLFKCEKLTTIYLGSNVNEIQYNAFSNCQELMDIYCYAENVPITSTSAFEGSYIGFATLHVPRGSIESYQATSPWSEFGTIVALPSMTFKLTYMVDGEVYKSYELEYGSPITPEPAPTKEGYTFSGWSNIPETMPAHDVTVTGSFTETIYHTLTYIVDSQIYKTYTVAYGSAITPEPVPTKEGYTFSGWSYIPPTMPATDVVVMGTFSINSYTLTYMVDGEEYKSMSVQYGSTITPEAEPTKEGYTFSGWSEIPETMPAYDVTVTGTFTKDILGTCATPTIGYANGELTFNSETEGVTFHYDIDIEDNEIRNGNSDKVQLSVTYHISVYATKEDYYDSEVATGTLCWIDVKPATEGIIIKDDATEVNEVKALPVLIQSNGGTITVQGANEGTPIAIYDIDGKQYGSAISEKECTTIATSLRPGTIAIVKIGKKSIKVLVK